MSTIDAPPASEPSLSADLTRWRRHLHTMPETGFEELHTSAFVAKTLRALGYEVFEGIGGTGLVASLQVGQGNRVIGIRAEMDALNMAETAAGRAWASAHPGKMHACGHDGHMSIVLGAARLLRERKNFSGTVRFIFQPAEEHGRGAKAMMVDGLFERFPVDEIYGLHNMPGQAAGTIATRAGGIMASEDNFAIHIKGRGTHAARPHMGIDPIVIGADARSQRASRGVVHRVHHRWHSQCDSFQRGHQGRYAQLRPASAGHAGEAHARDLRGHVQAARRRVPV
jgi:amidohydrolase